MYEKGVGVKLRKNMAQGMKGRPVDVNIVQVYVSIADKKDEEVYHFYNIVNEDLKNLQKEDVIIVIGNLNAKLGTGKRSNYQIMSDYTNETVDVTN